MNKSFFGVVGSAVMAALAVAAPAEAASFRGLGDLDEGDFYSVAYGLEFRLKPQKKAA